MKYSNIIIKNSIMEIKNFKNTTIPKIPRRPYGHLGSETQRPYGHLGTDTNEYTIKPFGLLPYRGSNIK